MVFIATKPTSTVLLKCNVALARTAQLQVIKKLANLRVWLLFLLQVFIPYETGWIFAKEMGATPFNWQVF